MLKAGTSHCVIAIHATLEASNGTIEATNKAQPINPKGHWLGYWHLSKTTIHLNDCVGLGQQLLFWTWLENALSCRLCGLVYLAIVCLVSMLLVNGIINAVEMTTGTDLNRQRAAVYRLQYWELSATISVLSDCTWQRAFQCPSSYSCEYERLVYINTPVFSR